MLEFYPEEIDLIEDDSQPTDTDDEIRKCWDAHAVTDANSEPAPIEEWPISAGISTYFIRFEREDLRKLRDLSEAEGILTIPMAEKLIKRAISEARAAKFGAPAPADGQKAAPGAAANPLSLDGLTRGLSRASAARRAGGQRGMELGTVRKTVASLESA